MTALSASAQVSTCGAVHIYIYIYIYIYTHTQTYIHTCVHTQTYRTIAYTFTHAPAF